MIDPAARVELLAARRDDPSVAAVLLDVVLGDGAHPDPAASWPRWRPSWWRRAWS